MAEKTVEKLEELIAHCRSKLAVIPLPISPSSI